MLLVTLHNLQVVCYTQVIYLILNKSFKKAESIKNVTQFVEIYTFILVRKKHGTCLNNKCFKVRHEMCQRLDNAPKATFKTPNLNISHQSTS